jgi:hypothetical protein
VQSGLKLGYGFRSEFIRGLSLAAAEIVLDPSEHGMSDMLIGLSRIIRSRSPHISRSTLLEESEECCVSFSVPKAALEALARLRNLRL